jgi:multidrug efflux pump subunit AcrA (membrane-fusion protein)
MHNLIKKINHNRIIAAGFAILIILSILMSCGRNNKNIAPVRKNIIDAVFASGYTINSDEYLVSTKTEGFIQKSYVKEGDSVNVGDLLFQLSEVVQSSQLNNALAQYEDAKLKISPESPQIITQQTKIEQIKSQVELDKKNFERYGELVKTYAVSKLDYEKVKLQYESSLSELKVSEKSLEDLMSSLKLNLENAENQLKIQMDYYGDYFIKAKKKGIVLNAYKQQGELAIKGESLAKIGSGKTIAKLFIAEEDINNIKVGQKIIISLNTDENKPVDAIISKIYPSFNVAEQSFILEADFGGYDGNILANTQLQANIIIAQKENALVIPAQYLRKDNKVILSDNTEVSVEIGIKSSNWVEILSGVNESNSLKSAE